MRYCPAASVSAVRVLSINTGLEASIVTPGSTPPDGSLKVPERADCGKATAGKMISPQTATIARVRERIRTPLQRSPSADLGLLLYRKTAISEHEYPRSDSRARCDARRAARRKGVRLVRRSLCEGGRSGGLVHRRDGRVGIDVHALQRDVGRALLPRDHAARRRAVRLRQRRRF